MLDVNGKELVRVVDIRNAPETNFYGFYPDGTLCIKFTVDADTDSIQYRIGWRFENIAEEVVVRYLVYHIRDKNPSAKITLYLPYVPNARMDRTMYEDEVATLKAFVDGVNGLNFYRVYILDPHSGVTTQLLNRVYLDSTGLMHNITRTIDLVKPTYIFYPDRGSESRLAKKITHPYLVGHKDRDWKTGNLRGLDVLKPKDCDLVGTTILILDDICSYGGTFLHSARKLKELGVAKVYLYVTHCENSVLHGELINSGLLAGIYTTNTIFTGEHPLITVLDSEN